MTTLPEATSTALPPGLTSDEARERLRRFGPNLLTPAERAPSPFGWAVKALQDPMTVLLLIASPTYVVLGDFVDAAVTGVALIPIAGVGIVLERRAETALARLRAMTMPVARVVRDGVEQEIPARALVPGDVVLLREGDIVPADGDLIGHGALVTNEATLTGESLPLTKSATGTPEERALFAGTSVVGGRGAFAVTETGAATRFGAITRLLAGIKQSRTPLQETVSRLFRRLGLMAGALCLAVMAIQVARGESIADALIAAVSLAIAAIPEEFPMVFTLYLGLGAWRLARDRALVRRLTSVETLGSTTVICTDKTGTLTMGRLAVTAVQPIGLSPDGEPGLLSAAVLASEPGPFDPLDQAILRFAEAKGLDISVLHQGQMARDYPFDTERKYLSHVWPADNGWEIAAKGALEGILEISAPDAATAEEAIAANHAFAGQGYRVIAVAGGTLAGAPATREADEAALRFLGLVCFSDPLRPGVREALGECRDAGVRVIMITGDHPVTAHAVADSLELPHDHDGEIVTGEMMDQMGDDELRGRIAGATIFARTRPEQKHRIVEALRATGAVVAMTGDGVNDAPALREADIGIAMGERGTDVARDAADLVLLDDNFATIVTAVREGRRIFFNLRNAFSYLVAFHIPLVLGALVVPLAGKPLLLLPAHLILLELVLHPTVSLVFENEPAPGDLMRRPPRPRDEGLLRRRDAVRPVLTGLTLTAAVIGLYFERLDAGASYEEARGLAFSLMLFGQIWMVLVERTPEAPLWRAPYRVNRSLGPIFVIAAGVLAACVYLPGLNDILKIAPAAPWWWAIVAGLAIVATSWMEPFKRRRHPNLPVMPTVVTGQAQGGVP